MIGLILILGFRTSSLVVSVAVVDLGGELDRG